MTKVTLIDRAIRDSLTPRKSPYWHTVMYGRHVGYQKLQGDSAWWLARVRTRAGGYRQTRLAPASEHIGFSEALRLAESWFSSESVRDIVSPAIPVGATQHLKYKKAVDGFTVGDALHDYVEWKRIAAARSHFETVLSLINHHIIPRLGDVLVRDLTSRRFTAFCRDVLCNAEVKTCLEGRMLAWGTLVTTVKGYELSGVLQVQTFAPCRYSGRYRFVADATSTRLGACLHTLP